MAIFPVYTEAADTFIENPEEGFEVYRMTILRKIVNSSFVP